MANEADFNFSYDKKELRSIISALKIMGDEANAQARNESGALAEFALGRIRSAAISAPNSKVTTRIAQGAKASKSSRIGDISFGFAGQKFSGGATTQFNYANQGGNGLLAGAEFGSKKFNQFAPRSPRFGQRGNAGYFIYPTLRQIQPEIIRRWELAFSKILKEWG